MQATSDAMTCSAEEHKAMKEKPLLNRTGLKRNEIKLLTAMCLILNRDYGLCTSLPLDLDFHFHLI